MKILIAGAPKTGTTALFYRIKNSLDGGVREMFEPRGYVAEPGDGACHVLAKVLLDPLIDLDMESFSSFEKKIGIVRDPRDRLISASSTACSTRRFMPTTGRRAACWGC